MEWARQAERLGFHGIWVFDHFQPYPARDGSPVLEAWTTLAALSQVTERMVFGTLVSCAANRPPGVTVKMAENLHRLICGRFCLGVEAGWDRPEFEYPGLPFPSAAERSDRLEALLGACDAARREPAPDTRLPDAVHEGVRSPLRRTHAPNFQLFGSEREFALWRQDERGGRSSEEVYAYIRNRGALYGTASSIEETTEAFVDEGCGGFMIFCNSAPSANSLRVLAALPSVRCAIGCS